MSNKDNCENVVLAIGQKLVDMCEEQMKIEDEELAFKPSEEHKPYKQNIVRPATNVDGKYDWSFDFDEDGYVIDETEKYNVLAVDYKKLKDKYDKLRKLLGKVLDSKTYGDLTIKEIQIYCDAGLLDCKKCPLCYCEDCDVDFDYCDCSIVIKEEDL